MVIASSIAEFQRKFIFVPGKTHTIIHNSLNGLKNTKFITKDGTKLAGVTFQHCPAIIYFHGNAGTLNERLSRFNYFIKENLGLVSYAYRGYDASQGTPNEKDIISDALEIYQTMLDNGINENNIFIFGESLGTAVATQVAAQFNPAGVILEAPLLSIAEMIKTYLPFLPRAEKLLTDNFNSEKYIEKIKSPLLIMHGTEDNVVPYSQGKKLYEIAKRHNSKECNMITIKNGGHQVLEHPKALEIFRQFITTNQINNDCNNKI